MIVQNVISIKFERFFKVSDVFFPEEDAIIVMNPISSLILIFAYLKLMSLLYFDSILSDWYPLRFFSF
jgi:hypothetical protein